MKPKPTLGARIRRRPALWAYGALLSLIVLAALFAPILSPFDPKVIDFSVKLEAPGLQHWFGTDALGRDILSQVLHGARLSLAVGFVAVLIAVTIGVPVGLMAGYFGGWIDTLVMRVSDIFLAFPPLLLPIALTAALGPGLGNAMIAIGISWFPWYARIMRSSIISVRSELYISAARSLGFSHFRIMSVHALPNALTPIAVQASMDFGYTILAAASLSFIGLGARPPALEWGLLVAQSRPLVLDYWWTATFPGLAIFLTVLPH